MVVTADDGKITDDTLLYFGSHNLSAGAWGNKEKEETQIGIANWEMGIVFPPEDDSQKWKEQIVKSMVLKFPPEKYRESDYPYMFR